MKIAVDRLVNFLPKFKRDKKTRLKSTIRTDIRGYYLTRKNDTALVFLYIF